MVAVEKIIHLADLHIRTGNQILSRYEEYNGVFNKIVEDLTTFAPVVEGKAIIIIAGDVFHHKLKIESPGIKLILGFLSRLGALAPVYIIRGNHDYRQDFPGEPDLIESLLSIEIPNVTYLNKTGHYQIRNVGIGLVAIQEALQAGNTSGISNELPLFPPADYFDKVPEVTSRLALFHGAVSKTKLPNGMIIEDAHSYPLEWFKGYDAIMLGDIHLQQVQNAKKCPITDKMHQFKHSIHIDTHTWSNKTFAYAGSTVQQDFGEALVGHGFMIWDLVNKTIQSYHIPNDYGYVTLKQTGETVSLVYKDQYGVTLECLESCTKKAWFPKHVSIRVIGKNNEDVEKEVRVLLEKNGVSIDKISFCPNNETQTQNGCVKNEFVENIDISQFNTPEIWAEFVHQHTALTTPDYYERWKEWFFANESLFIPECSLLQERIKERNAKLAKKTSEYQTLRDKSQVFQQAKKPFKMHNMSWDFILCFGAKNYFNFDNLSYKIYSISAKNGMGKTSFLETICIALYGEGFPSRFNKTYSASIICNEKPKGASSTTTITLSIAGVMYRIKRKFSVHSSDSNKIHSTPKDITLDVVQEDGTFKNIHSGKTAVDNWVECNIGTLNAFLLSCMVTQNSDMDFFNLKTTDQKDLLDNALSINDSTEFHGVLKEAKTGYNSIIESAKAVLASQKQYADLETLAASCTKNSDRLLHLKESIFQLQAKQKQRTFPSEVLTLLRKSKGKETLSRTINDLETIVGTIDETSIEDMTKNLCEKTQQLNNILRNKPTIRFEMETQNKPRVLEKSGIDKIKADISECEWSDDKLHLEECLSKLKEWYETLVKAEDKYSECQNAISDNKDHPYNPECWACQSQPWKMHEKTQKEKMTSLAAVKKKIHDKASKLCQSEIKSSNDIKKNIEDIQRHLINLDALCWHDKYNTYLESKRDLDEWKMRVKKLEQTIAETEQKLKQANSLKQSVNELALCRQALDLYDSYVEMQVMEEEIGVLNEDIINTNVKLSISKREYDCACETHKIKKEIKDYLKEIEKRYSTLQIIFDTFGGFKNWLYTEKVIPHLQNGANKVIKNICEDRPLMIESKINAGAIHWFLKDGKSTPPIEKASGFQRFISGLAMRIALGSFGASGIKSKQLFLDEGFTACDADNLAKVGPFLENLPYDNIILVSHLDEVKACAKQHISIERRNNATLSHLSWGA